MIPELGQFALILALMLAVTLAVVPLIGAAIGNQTWMNMARPLAYGQSAFVIMAFLALTYAFISNDFSVAYVAENSNTNLPLFYRISAVWSAHEGSLLLWNTVLALWTIAVAKFSKSLPSEAIARVLAVMAMVSIGFLLFMLSTSDPFQRLLPNFPINGNDLNPLLQDPGLASHPPMLYMGYVGFSVAFAFAIAALISGKLDAAWARWTRPWTMAAWCFLTIGITLGSWWSYRVLGWGGWWFWDPVENASFLPWLTGTALIHSLAVTEKRGAFKSWTVLLAICAFSLSLVGTFLVRSGILTSVHAFAVDPTRGAYMLKFIFIVVGCSLLLFAWRAQSVKGVSHFELLSRETLLLSNNVLLIVAMITILLGTLYPLIIQALGLGKLSVGPPYFNAVFIPLTAPLFLLMGIGPHCNWQQASSKDLFKRLIVIFVLSILAAIVLPLIFMHKENIYVILGLSLAFWIIQSTSLDFYRRIKALGGMNKIFSFPRSQYGMLIAHIGLAICVIGVTLTSAYTTDKELRMQPGDTASLGSYQFKFVEMKNLIGPNYKGLQLIFDISKNGKPIAILKPEKRIFSVQQTATSQAAIDRGIFRDLYVVPGEPLGNNAWAIRIYDKIFIRWIWAGGLIMMIGGIVAMSDKRYRRKSIREAIA